ncbi:MAG: FkbM family methyltransferase [Bdellovibrionales bacterium]|nr:FkbM family methyltransferase [Bdellovibrionales bacterium]
MHVVIDIGANIGQFAFVLKLRHPNLKIYSFEPNSTIFPLLLENSKRFKNWECFNFGIGESSGNLPLYFVLGKSAQGSVFPKNASIGLISDQIKEIDAEFICLTDSFLNELSIPHIFDFIKIDVEGSEMSVIKGLESVKWTYLYTELSEERLGGGSITEVLDQLRRSRSLKVDVLNTTTPSGPSKTFQALFVCDQSPPSNLR